MTSRPVRFDVTQPFLKLRTSLPAVHIDGTEARADFGIQTLDRLMRSRAAQAHRAGLAAIAQISREGDALAQVEKAPDAISRLAAEKWPEPRQVNVDMAPKKPVKVELRPGQVKVELQRGRVRALPLGVLSRGRRIDVRG